MESESSDWNEAPKVITLEQNYIHIWRVRLDGFLTHIKRLQEILVPDEKVKAERYYFQKDRDRFIISKSITRLILGNYLNQNPQKLCFFYNDFGKPFLVQESSKDNIQFNISHSGNIALIAVTKYVEIGIDVEYMKKDFGEAKIAKRFFSPTEVTTLQSLPPGQHNLAFFLCWTRKEAFIKAVGKGLSMPLDQFDVTLTPGAPVKIKSIFGQTQKAQKWHLKELKPGDGYAAAYAYQGAILEQELFEFTSVRI